MCHFLCYNESILEQNRRTIYQHLSFLAGLSCYLFRTIKGKVRRIKQNRNVERARELLKICFDTFCENGLENTGMQKLADACKVTKAGLIYYFGSKDNIVIESTAYCMAKVEDDFMAKAPTSFSDIERFLQEMPYLTAKLHGTKYRFMYQVYASPQYREYGKAFFKGVNVRYHKYAEMLSGKLQMPVDYIQGMIYIFVRACVHYALFEDEEYLNLQLNTIRTSLRAFITEEMRQKGKIV